MGGDGPRPHTEWKVIAMTKNDPRTFSLDGIVYERKDSGYCYRDNSRIREEEFDAAHRDYEARNAQVREDINFAFDVDGHHFVQDWENKRYYRDGKRITRKQWDFALESGKDIDQAPAATKRPKKVRDVAFEHDGVTLTAKQADFLRELSRLSEDEVLGNHLGGWWCDMIVDVIGGQFRNKSMTVGAMISTICEKGLAVRSKEERDGRKCVAFELTDAGLAVWDAMGL